MGDAGRISSHGGRWVQLSPLGSGHHLPASQGMWDGGRDCSAFLRSVLAYSDCPLGLVSLSHSVPRQRLGPSEKLRVMNDGHTADLGNKLIVGNASQSRVATHLQSQSPHSVGKGSRIIVCSRPAGVYPKPSKEGKTTTTTTTHSIYRWPILPRNSFSQHIQS